GPTPPVPATTPPLSDQRDSGGFTAAERTLLAKLSTSDFKTCTPRANEENANVVAALDCVAAQTGPDLQPLVMQFVSHSAMQAHIDRVKGALSTGGDCSTGMSYGGHWKQSGTTKGDLIR